MIVKWASVEENSEMATWNKKKREKVRHNDRERSVYFGRMSVPYHSIPWGCLSPPFLDNKALPVSFQPFLKTRLPLVWQMNPCSLRHTGYASNSVEMNGVFFKNQCTQRYDLEDQSSTFSRSFQIHIPVCRLCQHIHLTPYHIQARRSDLAYLILKSYPVASGQRYKETQPVWTPHMYFHPHKQSVTQLSSTAPSSSISLWRLRLSWKR